MPQVPEIVMTVFCPFEDCQQPIEFHAEDAGAEGTCPACKRLIRLPDVDVFSSASPEREPAPPPSKQPASEPGKDPVLSTDRLEGKLLEAAEQIGVDEAKPAPSRGVPSAPAEDKKPVEVGGRSKSTTSQKTTRLPGLNGNSKADSDSKNRHDRSGGNGSSQLKRSRGPETEKVALSSLDTDPEEVPSVESEKAEPLAVEKPSTAPPAQAGAASCPSCLSVLRDDTQEFVTQLTELKETGADVSKVTVACGCGTRSNFEALVWIDHPPAGGKDGGNENEKAADNRARPGAFPLPALLREKAKKLNDRAYEAAGRGDFDCARSCWLEATEVDVHWAVPYFNLAKLHSDKGDQSSALVFIDRAEERSQKVSTSDNARVLEHLGKLRRHIEQREGSALSPKS